MKKASSFLAFLISTAASAQGFMTPQGLTHAGAGGPVSGTIPHGVTYPSAPPVINSGINAQPATPAFPTTGNAAQPIGRIPVIRDREDNIRLGKKKKPSTKSSNKYDMGIGETPSIMIEETPKRK